MGDPIVDFLVWCQRKYKKGDYPVETVIVISAAAVEYLQEQEKQDRLLATKEEAEA